MTDLLVFGVVPEIYVFVYRFLRIYFYQGRCHLRKLLDRLTSFRSGNRRGPEPKIIPRLLSNGCATMAVFRFSSLRNVCNIAFLLSLLYHYAAGPRIDYGRQLACVYGIDDSFLRVLIGRRVEHIFQHNIESAQLSLSHSLHFHRSSLPLVLPTERRPPVLPALL